jgi:hypothetical protein
MPHPKKQKRPPTGGPFTTSAMLSSAEDSADEVAEPAQAVAAAGTVATATTGAATSAAAVAAGRLAADGEIELFVIEKVAVHGRLLLFTEGSIRFVYGQQPTTCAGRAQ